MPVLSDMACDAYLAYHSYSARGDLNEYQKKVDEFKALPLEERQRWLAVVKSVLIGLDS